MPTRTDMSNMFRSVLLPRSSRKPLAGASCAVALALLAAAQMPAYAQACDECSRPRILVYGTEVRVPRPDSAEAIQSWWKLFMAHGAATSHAFNDDASRSCLSFYDGSTDGETLRFGAEYSSPIPSGPVTSADYIMYGIGGEEGENWLYTLVLEAAESREEVTRVSIPFSRTVGATDNFDAGTKAAATIMPLFGTIRRWEIHKRDTDTGIAMRDIVDGTEEIKLRPEKTRLETGERIAVEVQMIDCDGKALVGRTITFGDAVIGGSGAAGTTGGTVEPLEVTTDSEGRATVAFTAGNRPGLAHIVAYHLHEKPCGRASAFTAHVPLTIRQAPPDLWIVEAVLATRSSYTADTTSKADLGGIPIELERRYSSIMHGSAYVKVIAGADVDSDGTLSLSSSSFSAVYGAGHGSYSEWAYSSHLEWTNNQLRVGDIRTDVNTARGGGPIDVDATLGPEHRSISVSLRMNGSYQLNGRMLGDIPGEWKAYGGDQDTQDVVEMSCAGADVLYTRARGIHTIKCTLVEKSDARFHWGSISGSKTSMLEATIRPYYPAAQRQAIQTLFRPVSVGAGPRAWEPRD
jgi:hypothetical protein